MNRNSYITYYNLKKVCYIIGFFCAFIIQAQDQKLADSLEIEYLKGDYNELKELRLLVGLAGNESDPQKQLDYSRDLIIAATRIDSTEAEYYGYLQKGNAYSSMGDFKEAIDSYFDAARIADGSNLNDEKAEINIVIADAYSEMGNRPNAQVYYRKALTLLELKGESFTLAALHFNFGDDFLRNSELDSALYHLKRAESIFYNIDELDYLPYIKGNEGLVFAKRGENEQAESLIKEAIVQLEEYGDYAAVSEYTAEMSKIHESNKDFDKALLYANRSLELASANGLKDELSSAYLRLSELNEALQNYDKALIFFQDYIKYRDEVRNIDDVQKMEAETRRYEVSQQKALTDLAEEKRQNAKNINIAIAVVLVLIGFLAYSLFKRNKFMKKANEIIAAEKKRSEDLLTNILPEETAEELKLNGNVKAKHYEAVSVLFTDFKGFTEYSEKMSPEDLVRSIDYYFSKFDEVMERHGIEKIKTVGDAYMCASGIPNPNKEHALRITNAALEIVEIVNQSKFIYQENLAKFDIRVGINTGPIVAGVVGTKKFAYDIWGDTVNVASRMESSGEVGRVNISESTYNSLKDSQQFTFEPRGEITAKGKGKVKMYFVNRKAFV